MNIKSILSSVILTFAIGTVIIIAAFQEKNLGYANTVYQVYLDGKKIGIIADENELYNLINEDQSEIRNKFDVDKVYPPNGFEIVKYTTYTGNVSSALKIYNEIKEERPFTISGITVTVKGTDGKEDRQFYVLNYDIFKKAAEQVITTFIEAKEFEDFANGTQSEIVDVGKIIEVMYFEEVENGSLIIKEDFINADEEIFTDADTLSQYLLFGNNTERESYIVQKGDTIETIAYDNKLNTQEFLMVNPKYTDRNNLLAIGEEVTIALIDPIITFVYDEKVVADEEYEVDPIVKYDDTKYTNYRVTTQEAEKGLMRVTKSIRYVNGEETQGGYIDSHEILREAVPKIIVQGKKVMGGISGEYIETNQIWAWPTNVPYIISSPYGYRWGGFHNAIDITGTGYGSPIYAALDGTVLHAGWGGDAGSAAGINVILRHSNGYLTIYAHMSKTLVKAGDKVNRAQVIGQMGNTGNVSPKPTPSTPRAGTHVHFEVRQGETYLNSTHINPLRLYK